MDNTTASLILESSAISYQENQPVDPNLWDSIFVLISIFRVDQYISGNTQNITCFLLQIAQFIKQQSLGDKTVEDILLIFKFGAVAWQFINAIYESGWDKSLQTTKINLSDNVCQHNSTGGRLQLHSISRRNLLKFQEFPPPFPLGPTKKLWPS